MKKITMLFACCLLLLTQANAQQTALTEGAIAIIGLNTDYTNLNRKQKLAIVTLQDIPGATKITFTDRPWISGSGWAPSSHGSDGFFEWTTPSSGVSKGTVVSFDAIVNFNNGAYLINAVNASVGSCTVPNDFYWGNNNSGATFNPEQIIAFAGTFSTTSLLWAFSTTNWIYNANANMSTSDLPLNLKNAGCFFALGSTATNPLDNAYFANDTINNKSQLTLLGTPRALRERFNNHSLFYTSPNSLNFPIYNFQVNNSLLLLEGELFSEWNFNNGTLRSTQGINEIFATEDPNSDSINVNIQNSFSEMQADNFPREYLPTNLAGPIIPITNSLSFRDLNLSFKILMNPGAANSYKLQYSLNQGSQWFTVPINYNTMTISGTDQCVIELYTQPSIFKFTTTRYTNTGRVHIKIALPPILDNLSDRVLFRVVTVADPAPEANGEYIGMVPSAYYAFNINVNFDDIQLRGTRIVSSSKASDINNLKLSSNPVIGSNFIVTHNKAEKGAIIFITDMKTGRKVLAQAVAEGRQQTTVLVANLPKGNYVATFVNGNKKESSKFTKQ